MSTSGICIIGKWYLIRFVSLGVVRLEFTRLKIPAKIAGECIGGFCVGGLLTQKQRSRRLRQAVRPRIPAPFRL